MALRKPRTFEALVKQRQELLRRLADVRQAREAVEAESVAAVLEGRDPPAAAEFDRQERILLQALDELRRQMAEAEREHLEREAERVKDEIRKLVESLEPHRDAVKKAQEALALAQARLNAELNRTDGKRNLLNRLLESLEDRLKELEIGGHPAVPSNPRLERHVQTFREREPRARGGFYKFDTEAEAEAFEVYKAEKDAILEWLRRCDLHRRAGAIPPLPPPFVERWPLTRLTEVAQSAGLSLPPEWAA